MSGIWTGACAASVPLMRTRPRRPQVEHRHDVSRNRLQVASALRAVPCRVMADELGRSRLDRSEADESQLNVLTSIRKSVRGIGC